MDENWLDLTGAEGLFGEAKHIADTIRERIKRELGITVSAGVAWNKSMSKLCSDMRKPDFTTAISKSELRQKVWPLPAADLLFVGPATAKKLHDMGIDTIGQLAQSPPDYIERRLHKPGLVVWNYANGRDDDPVNELGYKREILSVGNSITTVRDLVTPEDIRVTTMLLAESVAERMREKFFRAGTVQVYFRYSSLASFERQVRLPFASCTAQRIGDTAFGLILKNWTGDPLRSLGVRACNLVDSETPQLSLMPDQVMEQRQEDLEIAMQDIRRRYGHFSLQRGIMVADKGLGGIDTRADDSAHTVAFYKGA